MLLICNRRAQLVLPDTATTVVALQDMEGRLSSHPGSPTQADASGQNMRAAERLRWHIECCAICSAFVDSLRHSVAPRVVPIQRCPKAHDNVIHQTCLELVPLETFLQPPPFPRMVPHFLAGIALYFFTYSSTTPLILRLRSSVKKEPVIVLPWASTILRTTLLHGAGQAGQGV